jgi:alkylation response protein AidB-like acyl-CoA dehydrogenase
VDFSLSAEQRELTEAAAAFARRELNQDLAKRDDAGEFPREAWRACAEFGIRGPAGSRRTGRRRERRPHHGRKGPGWPSSTRPWSGNAAAFRVIASCWQPKTGAEP